MAAEAASQRYSSQIQALTSQHNAQLAQQREATENAERQAKSAHDQISKLQYELQTCQRELATWRGKADTAQAELQQHRSAAEAAGTTSQKQAQGLTSAQMEIVGLKTQVRNLDDLLRSVREHLDSEREAHGVTRESLAQHKDALRRLQEKLGTSISEIEKGNRIITRLKEEHRVLRSKLKLQVSRAKQADMAAASNSQRLQDTSSQLASTKQQLRALEARLADKEAEVSASKTRLGEAEGIIAKNTAVIDHLNRSLSELEGNRLGGAGAVYNRSFNFRSPAPAARSGVSAYSWEAGSGGALRGARAHVTPNPHPVSSSGGDIAARVQARVQSMARSLRQQSPEQHSSNGTQSGDADNDSHEANRDAPVVSHVSPQTSRSAGQLTQAERRQAEAMAGLDVLLAGSQDRQQRQKATKEGMGTQEPAEKRPSHAYFSEDFFGPGEDSDTGDGQRRHGAVYASQASEPSVQ